jgi:hypothetical protein
MKRILKRIYRQVVKLQDYAKFDRIFLFLELHLLSDIL